MAEIKHCLATFDRPLLRLSQSKLGISSSGGALSGGRINSERRGGVQGRLLFERLGSRSGSLNFEEIRAPNTLFVNGGSVCLTKASTVTGAFVPVLMASSRASKSRIFYETLKRNSFHVWTDLVRGAYPSLVRSKELYKAGVVLVHDPHLFGHAMYFVMETFQIWNLACVGHGRSSIIQGAASTWSGNQQSILLGLLGTGPRMLKGRPTQTNRNKGPGRGRSKPLRRGDQTKAMIADGVMGRVRGSRRDPRKDEILVEMEILSTLPRPRARRRQYFNSDQLMSILMMALASSVETAWRGSVDSFYLGQEGSEIKFGVLNAEMGLRRMDVWRCSVSLRSRYLS
ncbi:hypothetical protein Acr_25g0005430 [Actinidia rufa]|uniref:Uncharacterized protein n=1 Tax=Actinidia rufa TaxID=165716 RepID=A0A7J0H028_9ERIC|nr:hypothetical protein Acr_25g0005430 [Actinidia rufa]